MTDAEDVEVVHAVVERLTSVFRLLEARVTNGRVNAQVKDASEQVSMDALITPYYNKSNERHLALYCRQIV